MVAHAPNTARCAPNVMDHMMIRCPLHHHYVCKDVHRVAATFFTAVIRMSYPYEEVYDMAAPNRDESQDVASGGRSWFADSALVHMIKRSTAHWRRASFHLPSCVATLLHPTERFLLMPRTSQPDKHSSHHKVRTLAT